MGGGGQRQSHKERATDRQRQIERQTDCGRLSETETAPDAHSASMHTPLSVIHA